ncbi:MAG: aldehyde ferredoxin oxidoreductase N-terminal domain-containing protein [Chloroflexota bacterium]
MTLQLNQRELIVHLASGEYQINPIRARINKHRIIGPVDYGWARYTSELEKLKAEVPRAGKIQSPSFLPPNILTFGGGPLAGSRIPGTRRLVFCGYSPAWEGFYVSSMGGAAYIMHRVGVDFVCLEGQAPQDSVLILNHKSGEISVRLEPINPDLIWTGYADLDGNALIGFYALQQYVLDKYGSEYDGDWVRVFAVGPAARTTPEGIIGSNHVKKGRITPIDDWAGRGGLGSRLLQSHRIAACIFGGDWEDPDLKDSKEIDSYFQQYYGESMMKVDLGATEKYRYVPGFQTGGTLGVNLHTAEDKLFSFNYASVYESEQARLAQQETLIAQHYLKQFNEESIETKNFAHCGEPCSVACKKYVGVYKKDYEPYHALGPQIGVFDQRAAEQINHYVDAMASDAIQMGGTVAWIMELIWKKLIDPANFGLPPRQEMNFDFAAGEGDFDVVADSARNAAYAQQIVEMILFAECGAPFRAGMRAAAHELASQYGTHITHHAVYTSHGEKGNMAPNQYWVPGMLAPMPMMGKYFVYYGVDYVPPRELGRKCVERMVYELFSENSGVCRFHRKWVEAIVDEIIEAHYQYPLDYKGHQFQLAKEIYAAEGEATGMWESERTVDIVWKFLEKWENHGLADESLHAWVRRFRQDKWAAARAYWQEVSLGIAAAFAAGAEAIPDISAPYQAARLDVMEKKGLPG